MARRVLSAAVVVIAGVGILSGCSGGGSEGPRPGRSGEPTPGTATPSVTRHVPPKERVRLGSLAPDDLCGLVSTDAMARLAFPVRPGEPREVSFDPPVRGCLFEGSAGKRSVLFGAQPDGLEDLGWDRVELGRTRASRTLHANDCTVYAGVERATLQVTVTSLRAENEQCETAEDVAGYALQALVR